MTPYPAAPVNDGIRSTTTAFGLLATSQFVLIAAITMLSVALPAIQREYGLTTADMALVSSAYGLSFSGLLMFGGKLADRFGHRTVFRTGLAVFCAASLAGGLTAGVWPLACARFAQGVGAAFAAPAAVALLGSIFTDPGRRERMTAVWGTVASIGASGGTVLSGLVVTAASWRWLFWLVAAIAAVPLFAGRKLLPAGAPTARTHLDLTGAVLITGGLTALSYGFLRASDLAWSSPIVVVPIAAGAMSLGVFAWVETRVAAPLLPLHQFATVSRIVGVIAVFLTSAAMATLFFFLALYLQQICGYSPLRSSLAFLPFALVLLITGALSGSVIARFGARAATVAGLVVLGIGLLLLSRITAESGYPGLLAGLLVVPLGAAMTFSGATVATVSGSPAGQEGVAGAVVNTAMEVGPTVGLAVLVVIADAHATGAQARGAQLSQAVAAGYGYGLAAAAVVTLLTAVLALLAFRRRRTENTEKRRTIQ